MIDGSQHLSVKTVSRQPLLTRKALANVITQRVGVPVSVNKINIACSRGVGPKPAARSGRHFLYDEATGLAWGWSLVQPIRDAPQAAGTTEAAQQTVEMENTAAARDAHLPRPSPSTGERAAPSRRGSLSRAPPSTAASNKPGVPTLRLTSRRPVGG